MNETTQACGLCEDVLPLTSFGVARSRSSGRNLYCPPCVRKIVAGYRERLKHLPERKAARIAHLSASEKVLYAIRNGNRTQKTIARASKLCIDDLGLVLAELILERRTITSKVVNGERLYFERIAA